MGAVEALVLLLFGMFAGVLSAVFDVLAIGGASFLSHFALWVVLNALLAVHVESRIRAILWSIPFTFGYIESYFVATVASFESYQKSLIVPLAAIALIAPLLAYSLWTARKEKNAYGQALSVLAVVGTCTASYLVNGKLGIFDGVMCAALYFVLKVLPVRKLTISRSDRVPVELERFAEDEAEKEPSSMVPTERRVATDKRHAVEEQREQQPRLALSRAARHQAAEEGGVERRSRRQIAKHRREVQRQEELEREERLRRSAERKQERERETANRIPNTEGMSTLGNVRPVRRSTRST